MTLSSENLRTYLPGDALPEQAVELFGHEVQDDDESVVIAASDNGEWQAGVYLTIDRLGEGPGAEHVASIRQLIVTPASRGRGLAGWLLRRAHTVAVELGCRRIRSTAGWGCPDHLGMYDRLGYERLRGEQPYLVGKTL